MRSENFDDLFRQEISGLEGLPPGVSWSKQDGWDKLNAQLTNTGGKKKMLAFWPADKMLGSYLTYATAAAVAVILASTYLVGSYLTRHVGQAEVVAVSGEADATQTDISAGGQQQPILEKSILFHQNLGEVADDKTKNEVSPVLIADPVLLGQLLMYNGTVQKNSINQPWFNTTQINALNFRPYANITPPSVGDKSEVPAFRPLVFPDIRHDKESITHIGAAKNTPMALVFNGTLGAVKQNINIGVEGSILFKLPGVNGKSENVLGVGVDTRYQFYAGENAGRGPNDASIPDVDNVKNGFSTFATASYSRNLSKKAEKPFWMGMKVGYLVQDNSNSFEDKTLMLEMIVGGNDTSKFKVSPQVYLTDDFKKVMPGIKLGMTLGKYEKEVAI
ncbi:hypothetical protein QQ020_17205 [Fulvivirgaceae bacterium BMA12]|uniref:Uncharacterized protein n=1 Tax=Agaribacillus aureus TaxID=3051825 RepID=A0ABT8LAJ8_9BACT|nr:hypothetical protein [Fulvivirgaceae bacterium BMA12]